MRLLDWTDRYRPLRRQVAGRTGGALLATALAWGPVVATLLFALGGAVGLIPREAALAGVLGAVEVPAVFLLAAVLLCTPLSRLTGRNYRPRRKMFGLAFFFCGIGNLVVFLLEHPISELTQVFIVVALVALALTAPLAATSTRGAMRRLGGRRWRQLHRLVYVVGAAVILHLWLVPQDDGPAGNIVATVVFATAAVLRIPSVVHRIEATRRRRGGGSLLSLRTWLRPT